MVGYVWRSPVAVNPVSNDDLVICMMTRRKRWKRLIRKSIRLVLPCYMGVAKEAI